MLATYLFGSLTWARPLGSLKLCTQGVSKGWLKDQSHQSTGARGLGREDPAWAEAWRWLCWVQLGAQCWVGGDIRDGTWGREEDDPRRGKVSHTASSGGEAPGGKVGRFCRALEVRQDVPTLMEETCVLILAV